MSSKAHHDDPRDSALESKEILPYMWYRETGDNMGTTAMFFSGLILVSRNRFMAWGALFYFLNTIINGHPIRNKETTNDWTNLVICACAFFACYVPYFVVSKNPIVT